MSVPEQPSRHSAPRTGIYDRDTGALIREVEMRQVSDLKWEFVEPFKVAANEQVCVLWPSEPIMRFAVPQGTTLKTVTAGEQG